MSQTRGIRSLILNANQISEVFDVSGIHFKLYSATDVDGLLIKINSGDWEAIIATHTAFPKDGVKTIQLKDISGLANTVRWAVWPYKIADNLTEVSSTVLDSILTETQSLLTETQSLLAEAQGDELPETFVPEKTIGVAQLPVFASNANRKGCTVQAKAANTGIIYIGFDGTVLTTTWVAELQAGMSFSIDNYRGPIHAIASVAGQKLGGGEW